MKSFKTIKNQVRGASMVECALIVGMMSFVIMGSTKVMGTEVRRIFNQGGGSISTMDTADNTGGWSFRAPTPTPTPSDH